MNFFRQERKGNVTSNKRKVNAASNNTNSENENNGKSSPSFAAIQLKINETLNTRDAAILSTIQRVARFANEGKNTARGIEEAWKSADTNVAREKVKHRCATKCKDLWNQLEKQKLQVTGLRQQNAYYLGNVSMNNITVKPTRSASFAVRLNTNTIKAIQEGIDGAEDDDDDVKSNIVGMEEGDEECGEDMSIIEQQSSDVQDFNTNLSGSLSFEKQHQEWLAQGTEGFETTEITPNDEIAIKNASRVFRRPSTTGVLDRRRSYMTESQESQEIRLSSTSESFEARRPSTTGSRRASRSERLYFAGQMDESQNSPTRVKSVSASDKARAFHFTKIDFALAVVECDTALLDIELMQSLISTAETAIKGMAPMRRPVLQQRVRSVNKPALRSVNKPALRSVNKTPSRFNLFSSQASMTIKALKRAVTQVDNHRGQRVVPSQ